MIPVLRIGTRGSPLALAQAHMVRAELARAHGLDEDHFTIGIIRTTGDSIQDRPLSEAGGKGLFTKELDTALIAGEIDLAVHSSKDLPTHLPAEIIIAGYLPREDARDAWIGRDGASLEALPAGAVVGTASLRRAAQIRRRRPDVMTTLLRGNVETRLRKVENGEIDATLLALAGLKRLGLADRATALLPLEDFPPACGQGAIGITARADDARARRWRRSSTPQRDWRSLRSALFLPHSTALAARRSPGMHGSSERKLRSTAKCSSPTGPRLTLFVALAALMTRRGLAPTRVRKYCFVSRTASRG